MDKLIRDYKIQKKLLAKALVEKDHLEVHESLFLKNDFVLKLGEPRYELHKLELAIARTKLKLEMMETCEKFKIPIDTTHIDRQLEKEFEKHYEMLKSMKREIDSVHTIKNDNWNTLNKTQELKELYLSIAGYIHPELAENLGQNTKRTWKSVRTAYKKGDVAKLRRLQKKVLSEYTDAPESGEESKSLEKAVEVMKSKTETVLTQIENLKKQFPFNEAEMLGDEAAVLKFQKDIDVDIKIAREVLDKLEKQILEKLPAPSGPLN